MSASAGEVISPSCLYPQRNSYTEHLRISARKDGAQINKSCLLFLMTVKGSWDTYLEFHLFFSKQSKISVFSSLLVRHHILFLWRSPKPPSVSLLLNGTVSFFLPSPGRKHIFRSSIHPVYPDIQNILVKALSTLWGWGGLWLKDELMRSLRSKVKVNAGSCEHIKDSHQSHRHQSSSPAPQNTNQTRRSCKDPPGPHWFGQYLWSDQPGSSSRPATVLPPSTYKPVIFLFEIRKDKFFCGFM